MSDTPPPFVMERYGRMSELDRKFDIEYWQRLGAAAIFEATWQMVVDAHSQRPGDPDALRLRRTIEHFQRRGASPSACSADTHLGGTHKEAKDGSGHG